VEDAVWQLAAHLMTDWAKMIWAQQILTRVSELIEQYADD